MKEGNVEGSSITDWSQKVNTRKGGRASNRLKAEFVIIAVETRPLEFLALRLELSLVRILAPHHPFP